MSKKFDNINKIIKEAFGQPSGYVDADGNLKTLATDKVLNSNVDAWLVKVQAHSDAVFQKDYSRTWEAGQAPRFKKEFGQKYIKIIESTPSGAHHAAFAFIDSNGNIYKPAGYKTPAKGIRGNVSDEKAPITSVSLYKTNPFPR